MSMTNEEKKQRVKKIFDELIKRYQLQDIDGLARFLEVKYQTLKGWERRGNIADIEPFLFKCQGINPLWLKTGEGPMFAIAGRDDLMRRASDIAAQEVSDNLHISNATPLNVVPVYGSVPAGWPDDQPVLAGEEVLDWVPLEGSAHGVGALRVEGHSMSPEIRDGMYVLYVQDFDIRPGDVIVATDEFNRAMVKQYALKDGVPWLVSINPEYPSFKVNQHYRIVGRVFQKVDKSKVGRGK